VTESTVAASRQIAGRYELEARIGTGGIGEVWRARHLALNSYVAIKFLQGASAQNESTRRRFTTEAQVTAQLNSRHAVQVFDFGVTDDGHPYLVMELLQGETLGRRIERVGRLRIVETARILGQSAKALQRAHQLGIVHRDFKPDNIVISTDEEGNDYVKVVDFGIAKLVGDLDRPSEPTRNDFSTSEVPATFTKTGSMLGTPSYMAPEQIVSPADVDLRADIWAFGVVAFECLTGCPPFTGNTLLELFKQIESGTHPPAGQLESSVPAGFHEWFDTACAPDPRARFPDITTSYKELLTALDCGRLDLEPPMSPAHGPSGGGREQVVVQQDVHVVDGHAVTMDAPSRRGVESRQNRAPRKTGSIRRISTTPPTKLSEPAALSHTIADASDRKAVSRTQDSRVERVEETLRPRGRTGLVAAIAVAVPLLSLLGIFLWRLSVTPASAPVDAPAALHAPPPAALHAPPPAPISVPVAPPIVSPLPSSSAAPASPPSASAPLPPKGAPDRARHASVASTSAPRASEAKDSLPPVIPSVPSAPGPSTSAPAPPPTPVADPESYR
jgi:serine/threonine-protein kinase